MDRRFYELQFEIENACLLDCVHCSSADMRRNGLRRYSDEDLLKFISLFMGKTHIYFTGGEPLLYENLLNLCTQIVTKNEHAEIGLYTTGNCRGGKAISRSLSEGMARAGIVDCYFSIYSDNEDEHDKWTATKGSLANTVASIRALQDNGISPKAHLVLNQINQCKIKQVIEFCQSIGMEEVRILKLTPSGNAIKHWNNIGIPIEEQNKLISQLIRDRKDYAVKLTLSGYPDLHPCRPWENATVCQAGINLLYIDADGYVFPCACTKRNPSRFRIGHIAELNLIQDYLESKDGIINNKMCLNELSEYEQRMVDI